MNYDKNSFLSGIAVGRQLKGWGSESIHHGLTGSVTVFGAVAAIGVISLSALVAVSGTGFRETPAVSAFLEYADAIQIAVTAAVPAGDFGEAGLGAAAQTAVIPAISLASSAPVPAGDFGEETVRVLADLSIEE